MTWDESKHPRDEIGRFTFSDGQTYLKGGVKENVDGDTDLKGRVEKNTRNDFTTKESITDILYSNSKKEKEENEYRGKLLQILKDLPSKMVLYSSTKELEGVLKERLKKFGKDFLTQDRIEALIGKNYGNLNFFGKLFGGLDGAGMLDLAHGDKMKDRNYIKDTISLDNFNDPKVASEKEYLKEKISQQFKDYNFDINKIKCYYFKSDSKPSQRLVKNNDFLDMIKKHKQEILQKGEFSDGFKKYGKVGLGGNNNFYNAIGKADFRNIYLDRNGNLHVKMYDTYDFNKDDTRTIVKAGASQMEKGVLKPFFTIHDIIIPKEKLDELWN